MTTATPRISVVLSVFDGERYLEESVESLLRQEGVPFEIVAVDDGSTDRSGQLLDALAARDTRLRVLHQENTGLTRALAKGCALARGELIARHDADDISLPGRLVRQARRFDQEPSLAMVACWARAVGPEGEVLWETQRSEDPEIATDRLLHHREGPPCHGSVVFRKDAYAAVGGYRPEFRFGQDSDLWLRLAEIGKLACVPEVLYQYRVSERSISAGYRAAQVRFGELAHDCRACRLRGELETGPLEAARLLSAELSSGRRQWGRKRSAAYQIGRALLQRRDPAAAKYLRRALRAEPWNPKAWMSLVIALGAGPRT